MICNIFGAEWYVMRGVCVLRAACCVLLRAACCVLRAACCVLRVALFTSSI